MTPKERSALLAPLAAATRDDAGLLLVHNGTAWERRHHVDVVEQLLSGAVVDFVGDGPPDPASVPTLARTADPTDPRR